MKYPDSVPGAFEAELEALVEEPFLGDEDDDREFCLNIVCEHRLTFSSRAALSVMFSGEEAFGRYLDLYGQHTAYTNLKHLRKRPTYLQYLDTLIATTQTPLHAELTMETKLTKEYETLVASTPARLLSLIIFWRRYLQSLHGYLLSFTRRTHPLSDIDKDVLTAEAEFNVQWATGQVDGWQQGAEGIAASDGQSADGIWCDACEYCVSNCYLVS